MRPEHASVPGAPETQRAQALERQHRTIQVHIFALYMSISLVQVLCVSCVATLKVSCNCCRCMHRQASHVALILRY